MDYQPYSTKQNLPVVTLRHLVVAGEKCIGLQFYSSKAIHALVKTLDTPKWSDEYQMMYVRNTPANLDAVFSIFKGVAWINCRYFFKNKPIRTDGIEEDFGPLKEHCSLPEKVASYCPAEYVQLLETRRYSLNTARAYTHLFGEFVFHFKDKNLNEINEFDIRDYVHRIVKMGKSQSHQNQVINPVGFKN